MSTGLDVALAIAQAVTDAKVHGVRLRISALSQQLRDRYDGSGYSPGDIAHVLQQESLSAGVEAEQRTA